MQREPTERVIIVIVTGRGEKREERREQREERKKRKKRKREKERRERGPRVWVQNVPVCRFERPLCTGKTRACVQHAGVLPVRTEAF